MARNIEIKARVDSLAALQPLVAAVADQGPIRIEQDDSFFRCDNGRLKLRVLGPGEGQLIWYRRADQAGPRESLYTITPTAAPDSLRDTLARAYGLSGRVRKCRTLFLAGRTRIHLDLVQGLGEFLELEVVLEDGEDAQAGIAEAHALMARLGIGPERLVEGAYLDLLAGRGTMPDTTTSGDHR